MICFKKNLRFIHSSIVFLTLLTSSSSLAQTTGLQETHRRVVGSHSELTEDRRVKVRGGYIRVIRSWEGDLLRWSFNPQHNALRPSEASVGTAFGHVLPRSIERGGKRYVHSGGGSHLYKLDTKSRVTTLPSGLPVALQALMQSNGVTACGAAEGEALIDLFVVNSVGFKWVDRATREWRAQYDGAGHLLNWGAGSFLIGQIEYDPAHRIIGYRDRDGTLSYCSKSRSERKGRVSHRLLGNTISYTC